MAAPDMENILLSNLASNTQASGHRTNVGAENATQALSVIQNTLLQQTGVVAMTSIQRADDAEAAMGLNTATTVPASAK